MKSGCVWYTSVCMLMDKLVHCLMRIIMAIMDITMGLNYDSC